MKTVMDDPLLKQWLAVDNQEVESGIENRIEDRYAEVEPDTKSSIVDFTKEMVINEIIEDRKQLIIQLKKISEGSMSKMQVAKRLEDFIEWAEQLL